MIASYRLKAFAGSIGVIAGWIVYLPHATADEASERTRLHNRAMAYRYEHVLKNPAAAESVLQQNLQDAQTHHLKDPQDVEDITSVFGDLFVAQMALGDFYTRQIRYSEAEHQYKDALRTLDRANGATHLLPFPDEADDWSGHRETAIHDLAKLYQAEGNYSQSEAMYKRELAILEPFAKQFPFEKRHLANVLNDLGDLYSQDGKQSEAAHLRERAQNLNPSATTNSR